jgi:hypothetical protein
MSDDKIERSLGRPLRRSPLEQQLGKPLSRPALPPPETDLDDQPMTATTRTHVRLDHWPDEKVASQIEEFSLAPGEVMQTVEWYFPLIWAAALFVVCYIGIYYAVDKITAHNPLPPNFGM